nr:unnamed protein product [Digitaria exilis]
MMVGLVQLLVAFVVAWEAIELVLRHGLLLSVFKLGVLAALAAAAGCVAVILLARAVAWVLRRAAKLSIGCRSYGLNYLRDITISSPKGAVESICIGEIRLDLRKPLTQLGFTILTHGPILQLQISDLDFVLRQPAKSANKKKPSPRKPSSSSSIKSKGKSKGQAKWRLITSVASLLSLSIVELRLKAPKAALGIKDLKIDISKTGGLDPVLNVQINLIPLFVQALESDSIDSNTSVFSKLDWWVSGQYCSAMDTSDCSTFLFEDISLSCDLHQRDKGIKVKNLDLILGPIVVNLEEKLFTKKKQSASTVADQKDGSSVDNKSAVRSEGGKLASLNKKISLFPEKVSFNMSKLDLKFLPKDHGLSVNNEIGSISLKCTRLQPQQDFGESATHLRLETDVTEIHLLMDGATSVLEVAKISTVVSANIPTQPSLPVQAEVDVKISGFQCNLIISRIKPLIRINSDKKKPLVLHESSQQEKAPKEKLALAWSCTLSAPDLTLVLHSLDDVPLYHENAQKSSKKAKGAQLLKINVAQCFIMYDGDMRLEDMTIADPKRVNFGSQGGRVVIINEADGTPRMAYAKHSKQVELESFRLTHKEDQLDNKPVEETKLFDVRKAKFVQRSGGQNDVATCSLINVTDIAIRWEPDPYLELLEVATRLKSVLHRIKLHNSVTEVKDDTLSMDIPAKKEDHGQHEKAQRKRESVIAIDLESLKISGEFADGVEAMVQINNMPLQPDDPAKDLTLHFTKFRVEIAFSRGKQIFTFDCKREPLDLVYQGIDLHLVKVFLNRTPEASTFKDSKIENKSTKDRDSPGCEKGKKKTNSTEKSRDDGFFLHSDYFTIRKQTPKADAARLSAWQEDGRKKSEMPLIKSEFDGGDESDHDQSGSDDEGFNVVVADSCQRVFVHGLKILWNLENRAAILSWVGGLTQAFQPPKPSPSRQYTQRKILEKKQLIKEAEMPKDGALNSVSSASQPSEPQQIKSSESPPSSGSSKSDQTSSSETALKPSNNSDAEEEGTRHFMVNVVQPQFNLHSEEANVKPLKELAFNSPDITAGMTSRQFQVMMDVLTNLLFARTPRKPKSNLSYPLDNDDDDIEEASDAIVPDGVEEVELAKISVEVKERARNLLLDDIRALCTSAESSHDQSSSPKADDSTWIVSGSRLMLVKQLKKGLVNIRNGRKEAYSTLRIAMQKAAQLRLMEKEKNKSPSCAMRVSTRINKIVWSMLADGKSFAEAEINDMIFDFDRDYKDIGIAQLTTKLFVLKNGLANAKSDTVLAPWNPPSEWGKNAMLRVNARQGAPTGGNSVIESFLVDIYPLKIYLTEAMYRMMWGYFFPGEEQQPQKRQELFKVSTTAGTRRKKSTSGVETNSPNNQSSKESTFSQKPELRRTSSFDRTWEETVAESVANELVSQIQVHSNAQTESQDTAKDSKLLRPVRSTREDKKIEPNEVKQTRPQKLMDFRNIKISQVELLLTYEGLPFAVSDVRLLMDTFHREDFTGTWPRLFARVKKHIVWGVLKSVTGMQARNFYFLITFEGKKFKAKSTSQKEPSAALISASDFNLSDSDGDDAGNSDQLPAFLKKPSDGAGDGFATSVKGLFNSQKKKAKAFVLKTMKGEADHDFHGERSENEIEFSPFARQLTITKTKKLIRRHTKKLNKSKVHKNAGGILTIDWHYDG